MLKKILPRTQIASLVLSTMTIVTMVNAEPSKNHLSQVGVHDIWYSAPKSTAEQVSKILNKTKIDFLCPSKYCIDPIYQYYTNTIYKLMYFLPGASILV